MNNTTAVQKRQETSLSTLVKSPSIQERFTQVLGKRAPQFISSLIQVGNSLGEDCDSMTIISGAMVAASLDLPINKNLGFAWLVPFKEHGNKKAQFQMGYKGYIQLALRTGQYRRMNAGPINAECVGGYDTVGERVLDFTQYDPEAPAAGYFFAFEMVNGFTKVAYWSKKDVETHAKNYSQSYRGGYNSPWKTHFDEMATKTVIANELRQWGILSVEMQAAIQADQGIIRGLDNTEITHPDNAKPLVDVDTSVVVEVGGEKLETGPEPGDDGDLGPVAKQPAAAPQKAPAKPARPAPTNTPPRSPAPPEASRPVAGLRTGTGEPITPPHVLLEGIVTGAIDENGQPLGLTYDQFARWSEGVGIVPNCTSYASFGEIPKVDIAKALRVQQHIVPGILKTLGGEA